MNINKGALNCVVDRVTTRDRVSFLNVSAGKSFLSFTFFTGTAKELVDKLQKGQQVTVQYELSTEVLKRGGIDVQAPDGKKIYVPMLKGTGVSDPQRSVIEGAIAPGDDVAF